MRDLVMLDCGLVTPETTPPFVGIKRDFSRKEVMNGTRHISFLSDPQQ